MPPSRRVLGDLIAHEFTDVCVRRCFGLKTDGAKCGETNGLPIAPSKNFIGWLSDLGDLILVVAFPVPSVVREVARPRTLHIQPLRGRADLLPLALVVW